MGVKPLLIHIFSRFLQNLENPSVGWEGCCKDVVLPTQISNDDQGQFALFESGGVDSRPFQAVNPVKEARDKLVTDKPSL